jgi:hypothetical protein
MGSDLDDNECGIDSVDAFERYSSLPVECDSALVVTMRNDVPPLRRPRPPIDGFGRPPPPLPVRLPLSLPSPSSAPSDSAFLDRLHFSLQYFTYSVLITINFFETVERILRRKALTSSQFFSHFFRHSIGLPQTVQSLTGRFDFVYFFGGPSLDFSRITINRVSRMRSGDFKA